MSFKHLFRSRLKWIQKIESKNTFKNHNIEIAGKETLQLSAAKAFKGDPTKHNPEDLLLSAVSSCHMMSYLYCCQKNGIEILKYEDNTTAVLETNMKGGGEIILVELQPVIQLKDFSQIDLALQLHQEASQLCFIANSCKFPVKYYPDFTN